MWKVLYSQVPKTCSREEAQDAIYVHHGGQSLVACLCCDLKVVSDGTQNSSSAWSARDTTSHLDLTSFTVLAEYSTQLSAEEALDHPLKLDGLAVEMKALFLRSEGKGKTTTGGKKQLPATLGSSSSVVVRLSNVGSHCTVGEVYSKLTSCLQGGASSSSESARCYSHITSLQPMVHPQGSWIVQFATSRTGGGGEVLCPSLESLMNPQGVGSRMLHELGWSVMPNEGGGAATTPSCNNNTTSSGGGAAAIQGKDLTVGGAVHRPYLYKQFRQPHLQEIPNRAYWDRYGNMVFDRHDLRGQQQQQQQQ